jgi:hypothetical protein
MVDKSSAVMSLRGTSVLCDLVEFASDDDWDEWDTVVVDDDGKVQTQNKGRRKKKASGSSVVITDPLGEGADDEWDGWDAVKIDQSGQVVSASYDPDGRRQVPSDSAVVIVDPKGEYHE